MIVDSENYSDFDPLQAQKTSLLVKMTDQPMCLLSDCLSEFLHILSNNSTIYEILGDFATAFNQENESNPLDLLTEPKLVPNLTSVLKQAARNSLTKSRKGVAPISEDILVPMLYFLFPDAEEEASFPYVDKSDKTFTFGDKCEKGADDEDNVKKVSSVPMVHCV